MNSKTCSGIFFSLFRDVELGNAGEGVPGDIGDAWEPFEKEDMYDMFRRQFLEKLALVDEGAMRRCVQCIQLEGQVKKKPAL